MTQPLYYEYAVQPGETIATLIHKLYGWSPPTRRYGEILEAIKALNPPRCPTFRTCGRAPCCACPTARLP
jgi:hypothetical protein